MTRMLSRVWWAVALRGLAAALFGVAALFWPGATLLAVIYLFGAHALADGALTLGALLGGVRMRPWWAQLVGALLSIAAALVALTWVGLTALTLLYLIAAWALLRGVTDIAAAIQWRKEINNEWVLALAGVISITFATMLFVQSGVGILALLWMVGVYAILIGGLLTALGFRLRGLGKRGGEGRAAARGVH